MVFLSDWTYSLGVAGRVSEGQSSSVEVMALSGHVSNMVDAHGRSEVTKLSLGADTAAVVLFLLLKTSTHSFLMVPAHTHHISSTNPIQ